jgi:hypothetical protein
MTVRLAGRTRDHYLSVRSTIFRAKNSEKLSADIEIIDWTK